MLSSKTVVWAINPRAELLQGGRNAEQIPRMNIGVAHPIIVNPSAAHRSQKKRIDSAATPVKVTVFIKPLMSSCCKARG